MTSGRTEYVHTHLRPRHHSLPSSFPFSDPLSSIVSSPSCRVAKSKGELIQVAKVPLGTGIVQMMKEAARIVDPSISFLVVVVQPSGSFEVKRPKMRHLA